MAQKEYELTQSGLNALKDELDRRKVSDRTEIAERIKVALSFGDLSENSEYDDAKQSQAENEARIMEIEDILKNARVIEDEDISSTNVSLGSEVTLLDQETGESQVFTIVSPKEEDILSSKISSESPVGAAIMGKKRNQVAQVKTPAGMLKYKITKIGVPSNGSK